MPRLSEGHIGHDGGDVIRRNGLHQTGGTRTVCASVGAWGDVSLWDRLELHRYFVGWRCRRTDALELCGIELKRQTYAAAAHALLEAIKAAKTEESV
jgi:hypothetical protein